MCFICSRITFCWDINQWVMERSNSAADKCLFFSFSLLSRYQCSGFGLIGTRFTVCGFQVKNYHASQRVGDFIMNLYCVFVWSQIAGIQRCFKNWMKTRMTLQDNISLCDTCITIKFGMRTFYETGLSFGMLSDLMWVLFRVITQLLFSRWSSLIMVMC